jgi:serine/threonine protein kinase
MLYSSDPDAETAPAGAGSAAAQHPERRATPPAPSPTEDLTGQELLGRYRFESLVGVGPIGTVYRARRLADGIEVAIKVLQERLRSDPNVVRRFAREAEAARKLNHPSIARILEHGSDASGRPFVCREWVPGAPLNQLLARSTVTLRRIVPPLCDALSALSSAHREGVVHGCLKPSNLLIEERPDGTLVPKLLDFGMGRLLKPVPGTAKTKYGATCVRPEYVAPEQIDRLEIDGRADVYSVGILLYELLAGAPPFEGGSYESILHRQREEVLTQVRSRDRPDRKIPREIEGICLRALAKQPPDRYQSPRELARALRSALDLLGVRVDLPLEAAETHLEALHTVSKDRLTMPGEQLRSRQKLIVGAVLLGLVCSVVWLSTPLHPNQEVHSSAATSSGQHALEQGRQLLADGKVSAALPLLRRAQTQLGSISAVLRWLGEAQLRSGKRADGEGLLRRYLKEHPDAPDRARVKALLAAPP